MTIFKKLILMVIVVVAVLCVIAGLQLRSASLMEDSMARAQNAARNQHLLQIILSEFGYGGFIHNFKNHVLRGSQKYMDRFEKNKIKLMDAINKLDSHLTRVEDKRALKVIADTAQKYINAIAVSERMHQEGKKPSEIDRAVKINDSPAFKAFKILNQGIVEIEKQADHEMRVARARMMITSIIGYIVILLLFAFAFFLFLQMLKKLDSLVKTTSILATGDVTIRSDIKSNDEIGWVSDAANKLAQYLDIMLSRVKGSSSTIDHATKFLSKISGESFDFAKDMADNCNTVAAAAEEMNANMSAISNAAEQTTANVSMVATASEQMSATINEISANAENAKKISEESVEKSILATNSVHELGQAADQISKVTETINSIAEQTNLLALNATIEAARAGDAGKGFAVVANEIKELAKQTSDATKEIKDQIEGVQSSTEQTIDVINTITNTINDTSDIVSVIASAIKEQAEATMDISTNINKASVGITEVAENISQASIVNEEVTKEISNIKSQANGVSINSLDIKELSDEMQADVKNLDELVAKFKSRESYFDIGEVKAAHFRWKLSLAAALSGYRTLDIKDVPDHHQCEFGRWFDKAPDHLRELSVFKELGEYHKAIHKKVIEIISLNNAGELGKAKAKINEFEAIRKKMFDRLDKLYVS